MGHKISLRCRRWQVKLAGWRRSRGVSGAGPGFWRLTPFRVSGYLLTPGNVYLEYHGVWYRLPVSSLQQERPRMAAAWFCLLAVALLHAPLAGAALLAYGVDCCAGGFCNVPEHHHHKQPPAASQHSAPMDCGHDMSGMTSCSMSCCKDPARPALIPGAFLLPSLGFAPAAGEALRSARLTSFLEISRFVKPLSPPPRLVVAVL